MELANLNSAQVLATRYTSAVGVACIFYDHLLTFEAERKAIWVNPKVKFASKVGFVLNRYATEILGIYIASMISATHNSGLSSCRAFVWVFSLSASIFTTAAHFAVIFRIYLLWDRRKSVGYILAASFIVAAALITTFAALAVVQVLPHLKYIEPLRSCYLGVVPKAFPTALGIISLYDLFLIVLTIYNALEMPRRRDIEVVRSLQNDSAKAFLLLFLLRLFNLIAALAGNAADCLVLLSTVWSLCSIINSHLQIRLERLKLLENDPASQQRDSTVWMSLKVIKKRSTRLNWA
ncbi:hypothetical protein AMATHDRAFT_58774 [Amanita thiersii Skay4041]|uniref:DUF6533 domain-containing protein n=1 Tax=Amanita thiersii Skay4041 TaxID=703135 RepID=A0A2A9NTL3_9AGAR|nr:hypothetical protein AMATHDRAFT_58774 [Amanita thiersii Skay4041]